MALIPQARRPLKGICTFQSKQGAFPCLFHGELCLRGAQSLQRGCFFAIIGYIVVSVIFLKPRLIIDISVKIGGIRVIIYGYLIYDNTLFLINASANMIYNVRSMGNIGKFILSILYVLTSEIFVMYKPSTNFTSAFPSISRELISAAYPTQTNRNIKQSDEQINAFIKGFMNTSPSFSQILSANAKFNCFYQKGAILKRLKSLDRYRSFFIYFLVSPSSP